MKKLSALIASLLLIVPCTIQAQLPDCSVDPATVVYILGGQGILNYDLTLPISATNPSVNTIPPGGGGLAVSNNLNNPLGPSPTFYTTIGGNYAYWDGAAWFNTGHSAGPGGYVNPGGGGPYIYNYTSGGNISRYDGTGPATVLFNIPGFGTGGPYDVVGHCDGGFYVLKTDTNTGAGFMRKYDSTATLQSAWTVSGTWGNAGGGFAIANNTVYYHNQSGFKSAPLTAPNTTLAFTNAGTIPNPSDMACCRVCSPSGPVAAFSISKDTICQGECVNFTDLSTQNPTSWSWTFNTGTPATSSVQDPMGICFNTAGTHNITLIASDGSSSDTVTKQIFVAPQINATISGPSETCLGNAVTLNALPNGNDYLWSTLENTQSITKTPLMTTSYRVYVSNIACYDSADHTVTVNPLPVVNTSATLTRCDANTGTVTAVGSMGTPAYTYLWSNSTNGATITDLSVGIYNVTVTDSKGCSVTGAASVGVHPNPTALITPYPTGFVRIGESIQLTASGGQTYVWTPTTFLSCDNCPNPVSSPLVEQVDYCVAVTDINGCSDTVCTTIIVDTTCSAIFVPNAFTPNGDNKNEDVGVTNICPFNSMRFAIFNRWGEKVFETNDPAIKWDGRYKGEMQPTSTFYYFLNVELINGRQDVRRGDITLIR